MEIWNGRPDENHRSAETAQPFEAQGEQAAPYMSKFHIKDIKNRTKII
jgi:hypothetical protein